jgi:hypothetical protein
LPAGLLPGLATQNTPGGISGNIIEGLSINLPPADGGVSLPVPEASAPAASPAARATNSIPPPKRKPKP